jgi:hypothetical protein
VYTENPILGGTGKKRRISYSVDLAVNVRLMPGYGALAAAAKSRMAALLCAFMVDRLTELLPLGKLFNLKTASNRGAVVCYWRR